MHTAISRQTTMRTVSKPKISPLYLRALQPLPAVQATPPRLLPGDFLFVYHLKPYDRAEKPVSAYLCTAACPQVSAWAEALSRAANTETKVVDSYYAKLPGAIHPQDLEPGWNQWDNREEGDFDEDAGEPWDEADGRAYLGKRFICFLTHDEGTVPVGYCTFNVQWCVPANSKKVVELEVEIGEVWLQGDLRGKGHSEWFADGITTATQEGAELLASLRKGARGPRTKIVGEVVADVVSEAGEQFIETALHVLVPWAEYAPVKGLHFESIEGDARW